MMRKNIDLNAELREWFGTRLSEVLGENPANRRDIVLDIRAVDADIFRMLYDYQVKRQWPSVDAETADILGVERSTIWRWNKRK